jgi:predicted O-methyltransferase YrrM
MSEFKFPVTFGKYTIWQYPNPYDDQFTYHIHGRVIRVSRDTHWGNALYLRIIDNETNVEYTAPIGPSIGFPTPSRTIMFNQKLVNEPYLYNELFTRYRRNLNQLIAISNEQVEGNIIGRGEYIEPEFSTKRFNLVHYTSQASSIIEVGFNAGHSALLFLTANPHSKILFFDLGEHSYSRPCFEYLNSQFPNRISIIWGDSTETIPNYIPTMRYDVIHIDGGHTEKIILSDIISCKKFAGNDTIVVIDDICTYPNIGENDLFKIVIEKIWSEELIQVVPPRFSSTHIVVKYLFD